MNSMNIVLKHKGKYSDVVEQLNMPFEIEYDVLERYESNEGPVEEIVAKKRGFVEVNKKKIFIKLCAQNIPAIQFLVDEIGKCEYADESYRNLVENAAPRKAAPAPIAQDAVIVSVEVDIDKMNRPDLVAKAKELGIKVTTTSTKAWLLEEVQAKVKEKLGA